MRTAAIAPPFRSLVGSSASVLRRENFRFQWFRQFKTADILTQFTQGRTLLALCIFGTSEDRSKINTLPFCEFDSIRQVAFPGLNRF